MVNERKFMGKYTSQGEEAFRRMEFDFRSYIINANDPTKNDDEKEDEKEIIESSLSQLYRSTVEAFPNTKKRQHATNTIKIANIAWMPFEGIRTLFVRGLVQNEGKEYNSIILFKNVVFAENGIPLIANDNKQYNINPISFEQNDVVVRCSCADFHWRWKHWNKTDESLYGRDRKKYEALYNPGSANPLELPGLCKHLLKLIKALQESKILY